MTLWMAPTMAVSGTFELAMAECAGTSRAYAEWVDDPATKHNGYLAEDDWIAEAIVRAERAGMNDPEPTMRDIAGVTYRDWAARDKAAAVPDDLREAVSDCGGLA